jgi:DNA-binding transcriptional LysR family regulator
VPAAAACLEAESPGMDLMLTEAEPPEALRMLRAGYVDAALVFRHYQQDADDGPPSKDDEGARGVLLLDEPVHLITPAAGTPAAGVPGLPAAGERDVAGQPAVNPSGARALAAGHPKAGQPIAEHSAVSPLAASPSGERGVAGLAAYAGSRWIAGCERCRGYLLRQCALAGFTPKIAFTTDDYVAVQALVAAGLGVATLPDLALRSARHPGITAAAISGARRHVFAMTYGEPPDPPATARLIEVLMRAAGPGSAAD